MKRRSINHDTAAYMDGDNASNSLMFEGDSVQSNSLNTNDGCFDLFGRGSSGPAIADIVNSTGGLTNEMSSAASADIFLNQSSYDGVGRTNKSRSNSVTKNSTKKPKRKSWLSGGEKKSGSEDDHPDLSSLIASELTKLSIDDRVKALEEVHGVVESIEEDPEEINKLFDQVKEELKRLRYKQAYEKAAFLSSTYVSDPEFVLHFLRADNYNPRPAAIRLAEHFKYKLELFGEHTLVRDIMYDDLTDDEQRILNSGFVRTLPKTDRAGRQIVVCQMSEFLKIGSLKNVCRSVWYLSARNAQLSKARVNMGVVAVYFAHGMGNIFEKLYNNKQNQFVDGTGFMQSALPYKFASVHFCFDNTLGSSIQSYVLMSLGKSARIRLRSHCGSLMECRYALKSFGIDIDSFDETEESTGNSWLQNCIDLDDVHRKKLESRLLPRPNDVLLGRGRPFQLYSGNLALTAKIDENRTRYMTAKKMHKKIITSEIVESIQASGGRFLKKVSGGSNADWEEVDFETARLKVSHSFRTMSRWHSDNDDTWNQGGKGNDEILVDSIPSISTDDTPPLQLLADSSPSDTDPLMDINFASANKRRKW